MLLKEGGGGGKPTDPRDGGGGGRLIESNEGSGGGKLIEPNDGGGGGKFIEFMDGGGGGKLTEPKEGRGGRLIDPKDGGGGGKLTWFKLGGGGSILLFNCDDKVVKLFNFVGCNFIDKLLIDYKINFGLSLIGFSWINSLFEFSEVRDFFVIFKGGGGN